MTFGAIISGLLLGIVLCSFVSNISKQKKINILAEVIIIFLSIIAIYVYLAKAKLWTLELLGLIFGIVFFFVFNKVIKNSKFYEIITKEEREVKYELSEEDFMNTKKGKIITIIVAILVLYAIASTLCIFRLNQKINSMVVITDELREEIAK